MRATLLRHPAVLPLLQARPAVTPATLAAVERGLAALVSAGFPLGRAVDAVNALTVFVLGHTAAEAGMKAGEREAGSAAWLAELDEQEYPLLVRAARTGEGADDEERFAFAVEALLTGFAVSSGD
ncbi:TetR/AcrR family transcriptional regulator C-terminal domain-containing protein [Nonomuraea sp. bgisy101]|uniref:TetR/AcrR family transcriptional regulator C-terminal domain-containing protein n=1 Tax=Nonomuraea sp. bgisy101 TaxID=3413784 RepID=UPI003D72CD14